MRKMLLAVMVLLVIIPAAKAGPTNYTITVFDEETLTKAMYLYQISNDTHALFDGRLTTFDSFSDPASGWTVASEEYSADRDDTTYGQFTCDAACGANSVIIYFKAAIPYYTDTSGNNVFNVTWKTDSSKTVTLFIKNQITNTWVSINTNSGSPQTTSHVVTNGNGIYSQNGIAEFKIENAEAYGAADNFKVYDVWVTSGKNSDIVNINNVNIVRDTSDDDYVGGLPSGEVTITISADLYGTANDYPERRFYVTIPHDDSNLTGATYILKDASGLSTAFITYSASFTSLSDVLVTAQRNLNGSYITIGQGKSSGDGTTSVFLRSNTNYQIIATKTGYISNTVDVNPSSQTSFNIFLRSTTAQGFTTALSDVYYAFYPVSNSIQGGPNGSINLSVNAPNSNLELWGFNLTLHAINGTTGFFFNGSDTGASGGFMTSSFQTDNFSNYDRINVRYFFQKIGEEPYFLERNYVISTRTPSNTSVFTVLEQLKTDASPFMTHIIALFLAILAAGFMRSLGVGGYGTGFIILGILGFFVFVGYFNVVYYTLMIAIVMALYIIYQRGGL